MNTSDPLTEKAQGKALRAEVLTLLLTILAVVTVEAAQIESGTARWMIAIKVIVIAFLVICIYRVLSRRGREGFQPGQYISVLLVGLALLPIPVELIERLLWDSGHTPEFLFLSGFRNLACGLAVLSYHRGLDRISCVISMFLMIFSSAISSDPLVHGLVVVFAVCGIWWLMGDHWDSLRGHLVGSARKECPKQLLIVIPILLLLVCGMLPFAAPHVASALPGFLPTSGGDRWSDPYARRGVNDGDALVPASDDARSFGPVETELFLESDQPSLYDVFNDTYGQPPKLQKTDRSIALPPEYLKHAHEHMAKQKQLGRQFSTVRRSGKQKLQSQQDVAGNALLYVGGRTPLHMRLEIFDLFDGVEWFPEESPITQNSLKLEVVGEQPWVRLPLRDDNEDRLLAAPEAHQLKIINLRTNRIPAPPGLMGIHIDKVDRLDMFRWAQDGIVQMDRDELPDLTVIHVRSRTADHRRQTGNLISKTTGSFHHRQIPETGRMRELTRLANSWTERQADDWSRIKTIISRLKAEYQLDRDYRPVETCADPVGEFLYESKRGTDYMFASSAALLLRSMGYSTRVVSGFYADPKKLEAKSGHTPIFREDVHFWLEIYAGSGIWLTLEPTPGYEILMPPLGLWQRCLNALWASADHVLGYWWAYLSGLLAGLAVWTWRADLCDAVITMWWWCHPARQPREHVLQTLTLLEQRGRWAGLSRSSGDTTSRWLRGLGSGPASVDPDLLNRFTRVSDWANYSPALQASPLDEISGLCRGVVKQLTLRHLRSVGKIPAQRPASSTVT